MFPDFFFFLLQIHFILMDFQLLMVVIKFYNISVGFLCSGQRLKTENPERRTSN